MEVPTIYKAYLLGLCLQEYPHKIWPSMVLPYLQFRILKFPLSICSIDYIDRFYKYIYIYIYIYINTCRYIYIFIYIYIEYIDIYTYIEDIQ